MSVLLASLQGQRSKLKAKSAKDEMCAKGVGESSTMISGLEKFLGKVGDKIAENELVQPDDPDDGLFEGQKKELEGLCESAEGHVEGAKRAKNRFNSMIG